MMQPPNQLTDAEWDILLARKPTQNLYAVLTTGIVCRHGCPARTPLRRNVRLFATYHAATAAGFRACTRCQPNTDHSISRAKPSTAVVPSVELPCAFRPGDQTAMDARPGAMAKIPPPTPDLPGRPTRQANSPDLS